MNATFPHNYGLPTYDDWVPRTAWPDHAQKPSANQAVEQASSVRLASALKWIIGVLAYVIVSFAMAGTAIALAVVLIPMLLIAPAVIAGLLVTVAGYVLTFFGLMS